MCSTYFVQIKDVKGEEILNQIKIDAINDSSKKYLSEVRKMQDKNLNEFKENLKEIPFKYNFGMSSLALWGIHSGLNRNVRLYDSFNTRRWFNYLKNSFPRFKPEKDNKYYYRCFPEFDKFSKTQIENLKTKHLNPEWVKNKKEEIKNNLEEFIKHPLEIIGTLMVIFFQEKDYPIVLENPIYDYEDMQNMYQDYYFWSLNNYPQLHHEYFPRFSQFVSYVAYMGYPIITDYYGINKMKVGAKLR